MKASCFSWLVLFGISQFSFSGHVPSRMMIVSPLLLCTGVMKTASLPPVLPWLPVSTPESWGPRCWGSPPGPTHRQSPAFPRNVVNAANTTASLWRGSAGMASGNSSSFDRACCLQPPAAGDVPLPLKPCSPVGNIHLLQSSEPGRGCEMCSWSACRSYWNS